MLGISRPSVSVRLVRSPFGQQAGRVVGAFGLARDERDGLLADTVFGGLSAQYAGDGRNRKAGALRDADEGLFRHRRVYFETKLEKYVKNRAAILFFYFSFLLLQNLHKRLR